MCSKTNFFAGFIVGGLFGAAAGILLAPSSGEETRTQLVEKGKEYKDVASEKAAEKSQEAIELTKELVSDLKERFAGSEEVQRVLDQVDEGLSDK